MKHLYIHNELHIKNNTVEDFIDTVSDHLGDDMGQWATEIYNNSDTGDLEYYEMLAEERLSIMLDQASELLILIGQLENKPRSIKKQDIVDKLRKIYDVLEDI
jgi:hypothetical protein